MAFSVVAEAQRIGLVEVAVAGFVAVETAELVEKNQSLD